MNPTTLMGYPIVIVDDLPGSPSEPLVLGDPGAYNPKGVMMTEETEFERIDLEKFRLQVLLDIQTDLVEWFAIEPKATMSKYTRWASDLCLLQIKQEVYGETLGTLEIKRPATWLQMLKEQHAPDWLLRRWPVRYTTETHDARVLYPKLAMPDETNNRVWVASYGRAHTEPERSGER